MATTKEYKEWVEQTLSFFGEAHARPMMGEYLLYLDGVHIGGIFDNEVLLKIPENTTLCLDGLKTRLPYVGAKKKMIVCDTIENGEETKAFLETLKRELR